MNLREMMEVASASEAVGYAAAKKSLPIAYLMEKNGHSVVAEHGKLKAVCPFHDDDAPSFTIYGNDLEHWGCWSCQARGDAVDMLKRFEPELSPDGKDTAAVFRRIRELITQVIDENWTGPSGVVEQKPFDIQAAKEIVATSQQDILYERLAEFIDFKRGQRGAAAWPYGAEYLVQEWGIGTYGKTWMIIPYWSANGELFSFKRWTSPEKARFAAADSKFSGQLYGEWREDTGLPILLCEGESDAWYAHYHVGQRYRVLALPTGVNSNMESAAQFASRDVLIAFDGDEPGRNAARRWSDVLEDIGANVRIVPIPENKDLSTAGHIEILLSQARPPVKPPIGIRSTSQGYERSDAKGAVQSISNWVFIPERGLHGDGTFAFEGRLRPGGDYAVLRSADLASDNRATSWAAKYGRAWYGSSRDARVLLGMLQADEVFIPSGRLVTVAGLHDGTFVWPGGAIGPEPVAYVPPLADAHLESSLHINPGPWETDIVHLMRSVQRPEVTDPVLAWMAAAPIRSLITQFPFLMGTGPHGSGKTETFQAMIRTFSGSWAQQTLRSSPHAVTSMIAATNAFVQHADEYRPGGRKDTIQAFDQLAREAYTQQRSQKGGGGANFSELSEIIPSAPLAVTGEDEMAEGSHAERMIMVRISEQYQNPAAYRSLSDMGPTGFPHAYLTWLQALIMDGAFDNLVIKPSGPGDLPSRQRNNIGVIKFGWGLLQSFMSEFNDNLGDPHFDAVMGGMREANKHTPIEEAVKWCLGEPDASWFVKLKKNDAGEPEVWVQVDGFYIFLSDQRRSALFTLPGKVPSIKTYLMDRLGGRLVQENMREFIVVPFSKLENP